MPWTTQDVIHHNRKAVTPKLKRLWQATANKVLDETGNEGKAIRIANAAVDHACKGK
jgi:hypothetical protein